MSRPPTATDGCARVWHAALSDRARVAFRFAIGYTPLRREPSSQKTLRWRETDSNLWTAQENSARLPRGSSPFLRRNAACRLANL
jgi:hypothetical protein